MKILVIKLGALGDVIMASSLIHQICKHHDSAEIWLLTAHAYKNLFKSWKPLSVYSINRASLRDNIKALFWARNSNFDRVYDLQSNDRTAIFCALSGINQIVGNHPRYPYNLHPPDDYSGQYHIYDRMLEVLCSAGIDAHPELPRLIADTDESAFVREWMLKHRLQAGSFVILHAGASPAHPEKCWPYFAELAQRLEQAGYKIIWAGAGADTEHNRRYSAITGIDATDAFSISALGELGRYAKFAITNDSGPMHVLSASGIPVFAFFGPTNWRRNHAIGQKDYILTVNDGYAGRFVSASLYKISVDDVWHKLEKYRLV